jgi:hypothetical protein
VDSAVRIDNPGTINRQVVTPMREWPTTYPVHGGRKPAGYADLTSHILTLGNSSHVSVQRVYILLCCLLIFVKPHIALLNLLQPINKMPTNGMVFYIFQF